MRRFVAGLLILVSAITLVLASTSLWLRRNVINTEVFVSNVDTMVDLPEVEARITDRVTTTVMSNQQVQDAVDDAVSVLPDRLQAFKPTVEDGIRSVISAGVQRLLTNDPFRPLTNAALTSAHDQLVAGQPVEFTLGQAKNRVPDSAKSGIAGQVLDLIPDDVGVTILTPADAPQVYTAIDLLKSAWWWLGIVALATLAGRSRRLPAPAGHAPRLGGDHHGADPARAAHPADHPRAAAAAGADGEPGRRRSDIRRPGRQPAVLDAVAARGRPAGPRARAGLGPARPRGRRPARCGLGAGAAARPA